MNPPSQMRVSDADRQAVVTTLGEHMASGRLTPVEFDERSTEACQARTFSDLERITLDLPVLAGKSHRARGGKGRIGTSSRMACLLMLVFLMIEVLNVGFAVYPKLAAVLGFICGATCFASLAFAFQTWRKPD